MRLLSSRTVERFKIINSHPSLLPLFPGAHAVRDALQAGASQSGTTIHWVDSGLDTGEVIAQERCDIRSDDSEESLHERIKILERGLLVATVASILALQENKNG
jgi:phosphoribosylglycinamide formyltransferase-1